MYPVAAASFILLVNRILVSFVKFLLQDSSYAQEPPLINEHAQ